MCFPKDRKSSSLNDKLIEKCFPKDEKSVFQEIENVLSKTFEEYVLKQDGK